MQKKHAEKLYLPAWVFSLAIVAYNWVVGGEAPFANMYHILTVLSVYFLPLFTLGRRRFGIDFVRPIFVLGAAIPLIGTIFMEKTVLWEKAPALQSIWFVPHVFAYMLAYALAVAAFILVLLARVNKVQKHLKGDYPFAIYQISRLAFPFFTFGMLSGMLWAEEAWGTYWSWDIKETWALITWMLYLVYFHCRVDKRLQKWTGLAQILAFAALTVTYIGVSYLPVMSGSLHSYV